MNLKQTAIVTGASRGIGKAIALALAKSNYQVALVARNEQDLTNVAQEIAQANAPTPFVCPIDIKNEKQVEQTFSDIYTRTGRIDVLVNAAGILLQGTSHLNSNHLRDLLETNVLGAFYCIRAIVNFMKEKRCGYIFNISSRAGKVGIGTLGGYCMSKFALMGLNDSFFIELAEFGIKVTAICPGFVDTEMASLARIAKEDRIPVKDIVHTIEFLLNLSPQCTIREVLLECRKTVESSNISPFLTNSKLISS